MKTILWLLCATCIAVAEQKAHNAPLSSKHDHDFDNSNKNGGQAHQVTPASKENLGEDADYPFNFEKDIFNVRPSSQSTKPSETATVALHEPRPEHEPQLQSEPKSETTPKSPAVPKPEPSPESELVLPEPAIKFDNVKEEDYGDDVAEDQNEHADLLDVKIIDDLVNKFLDQGEGSPQKTPNVDTIKINKQAEEFVNSSLYWNTSNVKETGSIKDETAAKEWMIGYAEQAQKILHIVTATDWSYFTNASPTTNKALTEAEDVLSRFVRVTAKHARQFDTASFTDEALKKQFDYVTFEAMSALSEEDTALYSEVNSNLIKGSGEIRVCDKDRPSKEKEPCPFEKQDLEVIFHVEKDAKRLSHLYTTYNRNIADLRNYYQKIVELTNKGAKINGFANGASMWTNSFDLSTKNSPPAFDMMKKLNEINTQITPFYRQLHAYMRRQIAGIYKNPDGLTKDGPIPAHLLGSMEGGDWSTHYEETKPFEDKDSIPEEMLSAFHVQNTTQKGMFVKAYRYFKSAGFPPLPKSFWTDSVFMKSYSTPMVCEPSAAIDMRNGEDFRVKMCAQLGDTDFRAAHGLLAQTYYQYLYREQPFSFREAASSSLSEAIANVFNLLASNTDYLYSQGLISPTSLLPKESQVINRLYKEALENFAKIPFKIAADGWRIEYFNRKTVPLNERWWELREQYEGILPPSGVNSSTLDTLMHNAIIQEHSPASRATFTYVMQFQILKALCPEGSILSEGCILSMDTTEKLREAMSKGSSISWIDALEIITGKRGLDVAPLLEYYEPLINWLQNTNERDQVIIGWSGEGVRFTEDEIPKPREDDSYGSNGILSGDSVAYPGGDCYNGQECLLDSHCEGKVCICNEGMYTLTFANTVNCVHGNPADAGFAVGEDLGPALVPAETTTPEAVTTHSSSTTPSRVRKFSRSLSFSSLFVLLIMIFI